MTSQQESFINLGKELGKKELEKEIFQNIIKFIDETSEKEIKQSKVKNLTITDMKKKLGSYNQEGFWKNSVYFKNKQIEELEKEMKLLKQSNDDYNEMLDNTTKELEDVEEKNKKLFNRVTNLRKKIVDKNKYILFVERVSMFFCFVLLVLDLYHQTYFSGEYLNIISNLDIVSLVNCIFLLSLGLSFWYLRPKVKVIKIS